MKPFLCVRDKFENRSFINLDSVRRKYFEALRQLVFIVRVSGAVGENGHS